MSEKLSGWLLPFILLGVIVLMRIWVPMLEMDREEAYWHLGWILPLVVRMVFLEM